MVLDKRGLGEASRGDLAVVRTGRGRARLQEVLGPADRIESVLEGLLVERGLRAAVRAATTRRTRTLEGRTDLRDLVTFTIDPETAKDFDDALSFRAEGDGLRAWVHIADVSAYVPAGSPLDRGAAGRALSTYVPGRVAPMLPPELADDLCSLRPHVDRLAVTVEVPFDASLDAGEPVFYRSIIRSDERLTYGRAERILAGDETTSEPVAEALRHAERLALELRRRRFERGALRIESAEVAFAFDGRGGVERAWIESEPLAHALVEELMILANEQVAELLSSRRRGALYRVHEPPEPDSIERLLDRLADLGVPTPPAPERMSPAQAAEVAAAASERISEYTRRSRPRPRGVREPRPALAQAGALRPAQPRPLRAREHRLLPLHLADPPLPRPRRPPRAAARDRRRRRPDPRRPARAGRVDLDQRAGGRADRARSRRHLPRLAARDAAVRARLGDRLGRRDRRPDRLRACSSASARSSRATCPSAGSATTGTS